MPNPEKEQLSRPGMCALVCFVVQCARLFWRRSGCNLVMDPGYRPGTGPLSCCRARCKSRQSTVVRCRGLWRRRPRSLCWFILPGARLELTVRPVGAHWFAGPHLAVAWGPPKGHAGRSGAIVSGCPSSPGSSVCPGTDSGSTKAGLRLGVLVVRRAQPALASMVSPKHKPSCRCVSLVCAARSSGQSPDTA